MIFIQIPLSLMPNKLSADTSAPTTFTNRAICFCKMREKKIALTILPIVLTARAVNYDKKVNVQNFTNISLLWIHKLPAYMTLCDREFG